jgi:hypothetical protein
MTAAVAEFPEFIAWLERIRACPQGIQWARQCSSILEAGEVCPSSEWLLWTVKESGFRDALSGRLFSLACLRRVRRLLPASGQQRTVALIEEVAAGIRTERELATAAQWAEQARQDLAASPQWSVAPAAAATALCHATAEDSWTAAADVRKHCLRAVAWDPWDPATAEDADGELAGSLRDILRPHASRILTAMRMRLAERPRPAEAGPCGGC